MISGASKENKFDSLLKHEQHFLPFFGVVLRVDSGVFSPDPEISHSTKIVEKYLGTVDGQTVADIGTGTGALAILAAKRGARKVVATDVNKHAVANAKFNIETNNLESVIEVVETSLLNNITDIFDTIIANLPIAKELWTEEPLSIIEQFVGDLSVNLNSNSRVLLTWASFGEDRHKLEEIFNSNGFKFELKKETELDCEWYLYILSKN